MARARTTASGSPDGYRLEDQVGYLLARAYGRGYLALRRALADLDITPPQHAVVMKLHELGHASQNELGRRVGMEPATIHGIVRRLKARRLVGVRPSTADKRRSVLSLTADGGALAAELATRSRATTARMLEGFSETERASLHALLRRLADDG